MLDSILKKLFSSENNEPLPEIHVDTVEDVPAEAILPSFFSDKELACKCGCKEVHMDAEFLDKLNLARSFAEKPWKVNSAYRCPKHNKAVGGGNNSTHMAGKAVDISAPTSQKKYEIITCALKAGFTRIGVGKNFVHLDTGAAPKYPQQVVWTY